MKSLNERGRLWSRKSLRRRTFLAGAGAAGLALPFMRMRGSAMGQDGIHPTRLIVCYSANGVERPGDALWDCTGSENDFTLSQRLSPLEPVKDKLLAFDGLNNVTHPGTELGHEPCIIGALTGRTRIAAPQYIADGPSIDQYVASRLDGDAPFRNLAVTLRGTAKPGFYTSEGNRLRVEQNPATAFARMFADFTPDGGGSQAEAEAALARLNAQRRGVLDFVRGQTRALRSELCGNERVMLDAHLDTIERAHASIQDFVPTMPTNTCTVPDIPGLNVNDHSQTPRMAEAQIDLIAAAVACQLTPVVSFSLMGDYERENYPFLGLDGHQHHDFAHGPAAQQTGAYARINDFYFGVYANLVKRLDEIPEGDGTVLDHSIVVYVSDMRYAGHTQQNLPVVWAGGGSGQLRTGRYMRYGGRSHADHLLTLAHLMGIEASSFGASTGPLDNLRA